MRIISEAQIYARHGADKNLASAAAGIYSVATYAPRYRTLEERIRLARSAVELQMASLDLLLRGRIEEAKNYLELALQAENPARRVIVYSDDKKSKFEEYSAIGLVKILLEHFDRLPEILKSALHDIDLLRGRLGFVPLKGYVEGIVQ
ncbi:hypothetical protein J4234_05895 [Candidatus Woesearchaeota archaeon]|nr:hypothetical protein [Candidatus Woesearchaeota archaeon]